MDEVSMPLTFNELLKKHNLDGDNWDVEEQLAKHFVNSLDERQQALLTLALASDSFYDEFAHQVEVIFIGSGLMDKFLKSEPFEPMNSDPEEDDL